MSVTGSVGGSTAFVTFNSITMLINWFESLIRVAEAFTVTLVATITNMNPASPFVKTSTFQLFVTPPTCAQSLDVPTITPPSLTN